MQVLWLVSILITVVLAIDPRVLDQLRAVGLPSRTIEKRVSGQHFNCSEIGAGNTGSSAGQVVTHHL